MKITIFLLSLIIALSGCTNDKKFYSLTFKIDSGDNVSKGLYQLRTLLKKLPQMNGHELHDSNIVVRHDKGLVAIHYDGKSISFNLSNQYSWSEIKGNPEPFFRSTWLSVLSNSQKHSFLNLIDMMIRNEISGVECCTVDDSLTSFSLRTPPFADRSSMVIFLEDEFSKLPKDYKQQLLENNIIIDRKYRLILMVYDKGRFLRYMYGSDHDVPKKWLQSTEEVFHK